MSNIVFSTCDTPLNLNTLGNNEGNLAYWLQTNGRETVSVVLVCIYTVPS
jgi:hypothetical protein